VLNLLAPLGLVVGEEVAGYDEPLSVRYDGDVSNREPALAPVLGVAVRLAPRRSAPVAGRPAAGFEPLTPLGRPAAPPRGLLAVLG
jgi:hypothetical protein